MKTRMFKRKVKHICIKTTILMASLLVCIVNLKSQTTDSISQYGITWKFDTTYTYGQFANGDYWVVGPVTITSIAPAFTGTQNGWEANPNSFTANGFDSRICGWNSSLVPSLPYTAAPNTSIVKGVSRSSEPPCIQTAAVLTVLSAVPPDNGATVFRPPYFGTAKPLYSVNSLHTELLPSLAPVSNTPTISSEAAAFQEVQMDHIPGCGYELRPLESMPTYGAEIGRRNAEGALRLMLSDPLDAKKALLINYVQMGIDLGYVFMNGGSWPPLGGYSVGRKLPVTFAAVLLDDANMKNALINSSKTWAEKGYWSFDEDGTVRLGKNGVIWQNVGNQSDYESTYYWLYISHGPGGGAGGDPYGYIDGGSPPGVVYDYCCNAMPYKSEAIAVQLMPEIKVVFNNQLFLDYADRWVNFGAWTQPDPCAPYDGDWSHYGITFGPDGHGGCIKDTNPADGIGRFPANNGHGKNDGGYQSAFANAMWTTYRTDYGCVFVGVDTLTHERQYDCSQCKYNCTAPVTKVDPVMIPEEFTVSQNYPNPFNPSTKINYFVTTKDNIRLVIYDLLGRQIRTLVDGMVAAGPQSVSWDGRDTKGIAVSSGVYFYSIEHRGQRISKQMVLIK